MRNPDVEVEAVFTTKSWSLEHADLETSLGELCCLQYAWGFWFIKWKCLMFQSSYLCYANNTLKFSALLCQFECTVPARMRFGFLKCSRLGSKGNSFENIHWAEKTKGDILSPNVTTFCVHHTQLGKQSKESFRLQWQYIPMIAILKCKWHSTNTSWHL